jgi:serine/threonine protein kinase
MDTLRVCQQCRRPLPQDAPEGLCPSCLARVALGSEPAAKSDSTLAISPEAFTRVRYFGDYELQAEIARGGMGVVWKARQSSLNRIVALKMILAGQLAGDAAVQRFRREAEAAANLQHPNIVAIHEVGEHDGQHYYSMDYVDGRDLAALVRESGPLPPARAAECVKILAGAVHFAHQQGTLHRDLKPQNVLIDAAGHPRITDFGLAKFMERDDSLTQTGAAMGSPSYMPPEQAAGHLDQIGPASDVYALGAILYELFTARPPFREETAMATMRRVLESDPVAPRKINPGVPPDLETICLKCLEKNPARRYHSAQALADELGRFLNREPIQALPVSAIRKVESWVRRHPWTLMAAASLLILILSGLLYWQYERVSFLQNRPLPTARTLHHPDAPTQPFEAWTVLMYFLMPGMLAWTLLIFRQYGRGKPNVRELFEVPIYGATAKPVSQRMRVVCGLIGAAALAFTVIYFGNLIHESVWGNSPVVADFLLVYVNFYFSLLLLFRVMRDYQKVIHGLPGRNLSAGQCEALRQAILGGDTIGAIKLVRRAFPDASLGEANAYVGKFAREERYRVKFPGASPKEVRENSEKYHAEFVADLKEKHPEQFLPRKPWDLNWRLMGRAMLLEAVMFAGIWLIAPPPVSTGTRLLVYAAWFLGGAGIMMSLRVKRSWKRFPGRIFCFLLPIVVAPRFYQDVSFSLLGFLSGMSMIMSGFTPKKRKLRA